MAHPPAPTDPDATIDLPDRLEAPVLVGALYLLAWVDDLGDERLYCLRVIDGPGRITCPIASSDVNPSVRLLARLLAERYERPIRILRFAARELVEEVTP